MGDGPAAVTVTGLWAGYGDEGPSTAVLGDLELALEPGRRLAVVGQSGCGKSTLLHALAGLLAPAAGEVCVNGRRVAAADLDGPGRPGCRPGHSAYMFQQDLLLPWRAVLGNATLAAEAGGRLRPALLRRSAARAARARTRERARAVLGELGLEDVVEARPDELSGGMRQRVALARTIVAGKGLVLLDEPFGSLDSLTRAEMRCWLLDAMHAHPATWVLVTHDVREAVLLGDVVAVLGGRPARLQGRFETRLDEDARRRLAEQDTGRRAPGAGAAGEGDAAEVTAAVAERVGTITAEILGLLLSGRDS
jgi:putative hydroxymethylpyrimidine transport system ATP-binding protein